MDYMCEQIGNLIRDMGIFKMSNETSTKSRRHENVDRKQKEPIKMKNTLENQQQSR